MSMLHAADRLSLVTDASAMATRLERALGSALPDACWSGLQVANALPGGDGGFAVQFTVPGADGGLHRIGGVMPPDPGQPPAWPGPDGTAWIADPGVAVALPTADPGLRSLPRILDPAWSAETAAALGQRSDASSPPELLAYRLGKRCVLRLRLADTSVIVKAVRPKRLEAAAQAHARIAADPWVTVPRLLRIDPRVGALVLADVPGDAIHDLSGDAAAAAHETAGRLLRGFHAPAPGRTDGRTARDEIDQLADWTGRSAPLLGLHAARLTSALERLERHLPADAAPVRIHRDFYDKQILIGDGRATLLDLDTTTTGDAALDLGNYLAHVTLRSLQDPRAGDDPDAFAQRFLAGYGPGADVVRRARWWRAAALLRLAVIYTLRPRWRNIVTQLLEDADRCLCSWEQGA
jgi:hypothetical protein